MCRSLVSLLIFVLSLSLLNVRAVRADDFENQLMNLVNEARVEAGSEELTRESALDKAAINKAKALVSQHTFQHTLPDGTSPWKFIEDTEYDFLIAGENLARNHSEPTDVVNGWLSSQSHRTNMLRRDYSDAGIATVPLQDGRLTVMYFAKPITASMQFAGVNTVFQIDTALLQPLLLSIVSILGYSLYERVRAKKSIEHI